MNNNELKFEGRCLRVRFILAVALLARFGVEGACQKPAYLAIVGPAAFRFMAPPKVFTNRIVLPASVPAPEPPPIAVQVQKAAAIRATEQAAGMIDQNTAIQAGAIPSSQSMGLNNGANGGPAGQSENVVSPQMFLKFFNGGLPGSGAAGTTPNAQGRTGQPSYSPGSQGGLPGLGLPGTEPMNPASGAGTLGAPGVPSGFGSPGIAPGNPQAGAAPPGSYSPPATQILPGSNRGSTHP